MALALRRGDPMKYLTVAFAIASIAIVVVALVLVRA